MADTRARPRRADAERSIARIVAGARAALSRDPDATVDDIAAAAGVGRMTVYGHFRTRPELVEAALADALRAGEEKLAGVDLEGDPRHVLTRLLGSSWSLVSESNALLSAAEKVLPEGRVRQLHAAAADRVERLIRRGQRDGVFRTDLPITWMVNVIQHVLHGAAEEVRTGRVRERDVPDLVTKTVLSILSG
ncbi:TetR family transcriptional regulator [Actinoplanes sp. Pm04-4]|uniref:TetR family transcriptional regulator n=1 Tax=Paractinoplanes pyxinae TaxID=2997416 RepID=A0ABT4ARY7_9ACTN|nr:TetR family transcriptional regulator [Actinoplanes pyxinae]MCY1136999.1 TetR family transcriptional regulator [Actinoplanes pyxinae]